MLIQTTVHSYWKPMVQGARRASMCNNYLSIKLKSKGSITVLRTDMTITAISIEPRGRRRRCGGMHCGGMRYEGAVN